MQMCFRTRAFSHFLLPRYRTSQRLLKTDKHLTGDPSFHLLTVLWISLGFGEHHFKVQDHSAPHFSSSACRGRNARPWAGEGRCLPRAEAAEALAACSSTARPRSWGEPVAHSQFHRHTLGSQTRPDSIPKPSLPSTTAVISDRRQQVPVRNTSKERRCPARNPGLGKQDRGSKIQQLVYSVSPPCCVLLHQ